MIIGFIGAGKMARALATGLIRGGNLAAQDILYSSRSRESGLAFLNLFSVSQPIWLEDKSELVRRSDLIILAIKPQQFPDLLPPMCEVSAGKLFLSLAAGISLGKMAGWLHPEARIVRAMPNMPMQIGMGATVYTGGPRVNSDDYTCIEAILSAFGKVWRVEEDQINAITALSGSGPAYVFHFVDALIRAAVALNLPEPLARELAIQTLLGSAQLTAQSDLTPLELATQVKSPGGTTTAGCAVLEENEALRTLMARCLAAARDRAEELSRGEV